MLTDIINILNAVDRNPPEIAAQYMPPIVDLGLRVFCLGVATGVIRHLLDSLHSLAEKEYKLDRDEYQYQKLAEFLDQIMRGERTATLTMFYDNDVDWVIQFIRVDGVWYLFGGYVEGVPIMQRALETTAEHFGVTVAQLIDHWDILKIADKDMVE